MAKKTEIIPQEKADLVKFRPEFTSFVKRVLGVTFRFPLVWKSMSLTQYLSVGFLLLAPKCSLCIFALSTAIVVCGLDPQPESWEYGLIGSLSIFPGLVLAWKMRNNFKLIPNLFSISGMMVIFSFLMYELNPTIYYLGIILILLGIITFGITGNNFNLQRQCPDEECQK